MNSLQPSDFIQTYIDKFQFVEAKKYLALKGPLGLNVVHDSMFPLLTFNTDLVIKRPIEGRPRSGKLSCFWHQNIVHPCLVTEVYEDGSFKVRFINKEEAPRVYPKESFLGEIVSPKISLLWKFRLWKLCK